MNLLFKNMAKFAVIANKYYSMDATNEQSFFELVIARIIDRYLFRRFSNICDHTSKNTNGV